MPQQVKRINLLVSVGNSSKQMQQTSGSSCSTRTEDDEIAMAVEVAAVDEEAMDKVVVVVSVSSLLMVCGNCDRSNGRVERSFGCVLQ